MPHPPTWALDTREAARDKTDTVSALGSRDNQSKGQRVGAPRRGQETKMGLATAPAKAATRPGPGWSHAVCRRSQGWRWGGAGGTRPTLHQAAPSRASHRQSRWWQWPRGPASLGAECLVPGHLPHSHLPAAPQGGPSQTPCSVSPADFWSSPLRDVHCPMWPL